MKLILDKFNLINHLRLIILLSLLLTTSYCLFKYGIYVHFDEFVGRGLYPGLAFFNGFDLYEPKTGPHITLYGWGMALFYFLSGFATTPQVAIFIAYSLNLSTFIFLAYILFYNYLYHSINCKKEIFVISSLIVISLISLSATNSTTDTLFKIHADYPALFFLLAGTYSFIKYSQNRLNILLLVTAIFYTLSYNSKLPTLPIVLIPFIILITLRSFRPSLIYIGYLFLSSSFALLIPSYFYGFHDLKFILIDHISTAPWSVRSNLFDGTDGYVKKMGYIEAIPLLFRYFVMYLQEFWHLILTCFFTLFLSFSPKIHIQKKVFLRIFSLLYFFTLPPCLSAIAHFGGVHNSLFFCNIIGLFLFFLFLIELSRNLLSIIPFKLFYISLSSVLILPFLRQSLAINHSYSTSDSPHQQAYNYLIEGNNDIYFGWYPISHLLANNQNVSCIEVPTWAGMTKPDEINFSLSHFPPKAKFLATSPTGYGTTALLQYLGPLEEVQTMKCLSNWRLYKIKE